MYMQTLYFSSVFYEVNVKAMFNTPVQYLIPSSLPDLSRSCGEKLVFLHSCEIKSGSGVGVHWERGCAVPTEGWWLPQLIAQW